MLVKIKVSALRDTHWHEYALRFGLGGLATVCTGLIAEVFGPTTGGLFLAFPAVFCASATLIEKHERDRKQKAGLPGTRRGRQAAALDALGAAISSFGLLGFAAVMWTLPGRMGPSPAFIAATLVWMLLCLPVVGLAARAPTARLKPSARRALAVSAKSKGPFGKRRR